MNDRHQLYRSRTNRIIGGVAGGIAEYFDTDPTIVRLVIIALSIVGGTGVLAYVIAWIIVPEAPITNEDHHAMAIHHDAPSTSNPHNDTATADGQPTKDTAEPTGAHHVGRHHHADAPRQRDRSLGGLILIAMGSAFLLQQMYGWDVWRYAWPLGLIAVGLYVIIKRR